MHSFAWNFCVEGLTCWHNNSSFIGSHIWGWNVLLFHVASIVHPNIVWAANHFPSFCHAAVIRWIPRQRERCALIIISVPTNILSKESCWTRWKKMRLEHQQWLSLVNSTQWLLPNDSAESFSCFRKNYQPLWTAYFFLGVLVSLSPNL